MDTLIALYPGQGSQKPQMALDLFAASKQVQNLFALASEVSHIDMYKLLAEGTEEELKQTKMTQLAVTLASRSAQIRLAELGTSFAAHSGFSLGELAAYAAAGIFDDETLFTLIGKRASLMDEEAQKVSNIYGELGMAAVIGLNYQTVTSALAASNIERIYASNDNSEKQVVIAGLQLSIAQAKELLTEQGARRVIPLRVSGPFHTPLMEDATKPFSDFLDTLTFKAPQGLVISSVDGQPITSAESAKEHLSMQLARPVRWTQVMKALEAIRAEKACNVAEVGFGSVLTGLWKNSESESPCQNLGEEDAIQAYRKEITHE